MWHPIYQYNNGKDHLRIIWAQCIKEWKEINKESSNETNRIILLRYSFSYDIRFPKESVITLMSHVGTNGNGENVLINKDPFDKQFMGPYLNTFKHQLFGCNNPIWSQLCTCHDSSAVVACVKGWPDQMIISHLIGTRIFSKLAVWVHKLFVKWASAFSASGWILWSRCELLFRHRSAGQASSLIR